MSFADRAMRTLPAVTLWLFTLAAIYVALRRSGVYGLVADAQNLVAIFGVLHAIAFAVQARHAIRRQAVDGGSQDMKRGRGCRDTSPPASAYTCGWFSGLFKMSQMSDSCKDWRETSTPIRF